MGEFGIVAMAANALEQRVVGVRAPRMNLVPVHRELQGHEKRHEDRKHEAQLG
jgi:hypothetical protein